MIESDLQAWKINVINSIHSLQVPLFIDPEFFDCLQELLEILNADPREIENLFFSKLFKLIYRWPASTRLFCEGTIQLRSSGTELASYALITAGITKP